MRFQLRHKEFGVYQGSFLGLGFWHPLSNSPEQGYYEFKDQEDVTSCRDFLCSSKCASPLKMEDLIVEPFDKAESDKIIAESDYVTHHEKYMTEREKRQGRNETLTNRQYAN